MTAEYRLRARKLQNSKAGLSAVIFLSQLFFAAVFNTAAIFLKEAIEENSFLPFYLKYILFSFLALIFVLMWILLALGIKHYFFVLAKGEEAKFKSIFFFFKKRRFKKALSFSVYFSLVKLSYFLLCLLPIAISFLIFCRFLSNGVSHLSFCVLVLWLFAICVCSLVYYYKFTRQYFLCPYIFFEFEEKTNVQIKNESASKMKKQSGQLLKLRLSFSLWFLFCVFIVSVPFVFGYYRQAVALFAFDKIDKNQE